MRYLRTMGVVAVLALGGVALAGATPAHAAPVKWQELAQSPIALSAVATAVHMLGKCDVPYNFVEKASDTTRVIEVHCANTGDGAGSVFVLLEKLANGWFVKKYDFAG